MIKNFQQYNESLRDQMKPKSEEEIKLAYDNLQKYTTKVSDYSRELDLTRVFWEISDIFNEPLNNLYYIDDDSRHIDIFISFLKNYYSNLPQDLEKVPINVSKSLYGEWFCYPNEKIAWQDLGFGQCAWVFSNDIFKKQINESLTNKMTPKSDEELNNAFNKIISDSEKLSDFKNWRSGELEEISELIGKPLDELYYVDEESENFVLIHDYIASILDNIPNLSNPITLKNISNSGDQCYCYPKQKVAYWYNDSTDGVVSWVFSNDIFKN